MRRPADAALTEAKHCAPAPAQVPGKLYSNVGATVGAQHQAASLTQVPAVSLPEGCAQRYAPPAEHHVDPFGILGLGDLWPANSTARVRPRPFPVGPAYNSSEFDLFTNISVVALVSVCRERNTVCPCAQTSLVTELAEHAGAHHAGRRALSCGRYVCTPSP